MDSLHYVVLEGSLINPIAVTMMTKVARRYITDTDLERILDQRRPKSPSLPKTLARTFGVYGGGQLGNMMMHNLIGNRTLPGWQRLLATVAGVGTGAGVASWGANNIGNIIGG